VSRRLAFGGWGNGLALGKQRRRTLRQVRLLTPAQMRDDGWCVCDDKACSVCTPDPEPAPVETVDHPAGSSQPVSDYEKGD